MPKPYPKEFRDDVVQVALNREPGVRIKDVAGRLVTVAAPGGLTRVKTDFVSLRWWSVVRGSDVVRHQPNGQ